MGLDCRGSLYWSRSRFLVLRPSQGPAVSGSLSVNVEMVLDMASSSIPKVKPVYVIAAVVAVIVRLLLWARRTQMLANLSDDIVTRISQAIATAEGFYSGGRAARNHNPGDLTQDLTGKGVGKDGPFIVYASDADGFEALAKQVQNFFVGSAHFGPSMSILQTGLIYSPDLNGRVWANNVAAYLGVDVNTTWG